MAEAKITLVNLVNETKDRYSVYITSDKKLFYIEYGPTGSYLGPGMYSDQTLNNVLFRPAVINVSYQLWKNLQLVHSSYSLEPLVGYNLAWIVLKYKDMQYVDVTEHTYFDTTTNTLVIPAVEQIVGTVSDPADYLSVELIVKDTLDNILARASHYIDIVTNEAVWLLNSWINGNPIGTTEINGLSIKTNSITANKLEVGILITGRVELGLEPNKIKIGYELAGTGTHGVYMNDYNKWIYDGIKYEFSVGQSTAYMSYNSQNGILKIYGGTLEIDDIKIGKNVDGSDSNGLQINTDNYWKKNGTSVTLKVGSSSKYIQWDGTNLTIKGGLLNVNDKVKIGSLVYTSGSTTYDGLYINSTNYFYYDGTNLYFKVGKTDNSVYLSYSTSLGTVDIVGGKISAGSVKLGKDAYDTNKHGLYIAQNNYWYHDGTNLFFKVGSLDGNVLVEYSTSTGKLEIKGGQINADGVLIGKNAYGTEQSGIKVDSNNYWYLHNSNLYFKVGNSSKSLQWDGSSLTITNASLNLPQVSVGGTQGGSITVKDSSNNTIVTIDSTGITIDKGKLTIKDLNSNVIMDADGVHKIVNTAVGVETVSFLPPDYEMVYNSDFCAYDKNGNIVASLDGWKFYNGSATVVDVSSTNPKTSKFALQNTSPDCWVYSSKLIPIDRNKTYIVECYARTVSGSSGLFYLAVKLTDKDGNNITCITCNGTWWYYAAKGAVPGTDWTYYYGKFGAGTDRPFPANAYYMQVGVILGYSGNRVMQVQGVTIRPVIEHMYIKSINASTITTGTLNASLVNVININASNITTGSLNASLIKTGTLNASLITTGTLNALQVNITNINASNITTGTLSADRIGAHTITADKLALGLIKTLSLYTRGTGYNRPANLIVKLNNTTYVDTTYTGLTVAVIRRSDYLLVNTASYDVYGSDQARTDLANYLNGLSDNVIVVLVSYNLIRFNLLLELLIERCGGGNIKDTTLATKYRMPYVLVGIPGIGKGNGIEVFTDNSSTAPYAEVSTLIVDGTPVGIQSSFSNYTIIDGGQIRTGTIDASVVNVANINASNITTGTLNALRVTVTNINASNITSGTLSVSGQIYSGTSSSKGIVIGKDALGTGKHGLYIDAKNYWYHDGTNAYLMIGKSDNSVYMSYDTASNQLVIKGGQIQAGYVKIGNAVSGSAHGIYIDLNNYWLSNGSFSVSSSDGKYFVKFSDNSVTVQGVLYLAALLLPVVYYLT